MTGYSDLVLNIPQILLSQWNITQPTTQALGDARIMGVNDPLYGTVGWTPRTDGTPFAMLTTISGKENDKVEANRIWTDHMLQVFLALEHSDTPLVVESYNYLILKWTENMRQVVASNRRLLPTSNSMYPTAGDVRWVLESWKVMDRKMVMGVPYYGVEYTTCVTVVNAVNYQG